MIACLNGILQEKSTEKIVVDVHGVGYEVRIPLSTYGALPEPGDAVRLLVHTHVREDAISLFGFASPRERLLFEKMISVSGVGPKIAIALLSGIPPEELVAAIRTGEAALLCRVPGVGRKTAERLVVDLRDKLEPLDPRQGDAASPSPAAREGQSAVLADVVSALVNLGYPPRDAERAVTAARRAGAGLPSSREDAGQLPNFQGLLKEALRNVTVSR